MDAEHHLTLNQLNRLTGNGRIAMADDIFGLTDEDIWDYTDEDYEYSDDPKPGRPRHPRFLEVGE